MYISTFAILARFLTLNINNPYTFAVNIEQTMHIISPLSVRQLLNVKGYQEERDSVRLYTNAAVALTHVLVKLGSGSLLCNVLM